ncbi:lipin, N-terminal conserved region-domain-containing protein, partial [Baffinella frigidus]
MSSLLGLIKGAYSSLPEINAATLSGAIDIVVVEQEDGSLLSSPFHVRFGRWKVLRNPRDRAVKITVNEQLVDFVMKLGSTGQAYFVEETDEPPPEEEATSPILSPQALQPLGSGDPADIPTFRLDGEVGDDRCVSPTSDEEPESGEGAAVPKAPSSASSWWRFGGTGAKKRRREDAAGKNVFRDELLTLKLNRGTGAKKRREDAAGDDVFLEELLLEQMKTEKEEMELEMAQLAASEANGEVGEDGDQDEEFLGLGDRLHHSADYEGGAPGNGLSMNRPASRLTLLQSDDVLPGEEEEEGAGGVFHAARRRSVELLVDDGEASPQFLHVSPSKELFGSGGGAGTNGAVLEGE